MGINLKHTRDICSYRASAMLVWGKFSQALSPDRLSGIQGDLTRTYWIGGVIEVFLTGTFGDGMNKTDKAMRITLNPNPKDA